MVEVALTTSPSGFLGVSWITFIILYIIMLLLLLCTSNRIQCSMFNNRYIRCFYNSHIIMCNLDKGHQLLNNRSAQTTGTLILPENCTSLKYDQLVNYHLVDKTIGTGAILYMHTFYILVFYPCYARASRRCRRKNCVPPGSQ